MDAMESQQPRVLPRASTATTGTRGPKDKNERHPPTTARVWKGIGIFWLDDDDDDGIVCQRRVFFNNTDLKYGDAYREGRTAVPRARLQRRRRDDDDDDEATPTSTRGSPPRSSCKKQACPLWTKISSSVLNTRNVQDLRERLEEIKYTKEFITLERFGEVCRECGCTEKKPEEYVDVMKNAGLVIQIEDYVYLEPQNITRAVINALPGVPSRIYGVSDTELKKLNEEYDQMREKVVLAEKRAQRRANQLLYGGLVVLSAQLAMFIRFTYVEFSWDVMEPISYFVGLANVIMGYIYFMFTQRDFSFGTWQSQMMQNAMDRQLKTGKFDVDKYEQMARKLRRRYMVR